MINKFLDYLTLERHYSPLTVEAYRLDLSQFCEFLGTSFDDFNPNLVEKNDIRAWLLQLMDQGMTARSVNRKLSSVKSLWRFALQIGAAEHNVPQLLQAPKMDKPIPAFFKQSEMDAALKEKPADDDYQGWRNYLIINLLYQTGMRCAELVGLTDQRIDLQHHELRVLGKRNKERLIPFGPELEADIRHFQQLRNQQEFKGEETRCPNLFCNQHGRPLAESQVYHIVHTTMEQYSQLYKISPHVLRHTFATTLLEHGADLNTVKTLLGHASLAATQVYTHTTFEEILREYHQAHPKA